MTSPLCDRCSEPITSFDQEHVSTASKRLFHRKCFVCSKRQCGKLLALGEYGVHQGQIFCPNCFIFLYKHGNTNGSSKENFKIEEPKNNYETANRYEHQLRTLQLHEDEEHETDEEDERKEGEIEKLILERENEEEKKVCNGGLIKYGYDMSSHRNIFRRPFEASPIPEVDDERESLPSPKSVSVNHSPTTWRIMAASNDSIFSPKGKINGGMNGSTIGANIVCFRPSNCKRCTGRVYEAEKVVAASEVWHKCCFRCLRCGRSLEPGKFSDRAGEIYCNSCYAKEFGPKGVGCGLGAGILQMHQ